MKIIILTLSISLLISSNLLAADNSGKDILLSDPYLSKKYQRGPHLVYDCIDKHWVCTGKPEYENCLEAREIAQTEKQDRLPCVSVLVLEKEKECNTIQSRITDSALIHRSCKGERVRMIDRVF